MRGDRTVHVIREPETDWQGDPIGTGDRELVATDCSYIPKTNEDDGSLVSGEGLLVIYPGTTNVPRAADRIEIAGEDNPWEIDGDVAHFTKGGQTKAWMCNVRKQR